MTARIRTPVKFSFVIEYDDGTETLETVSEILEGNFNVEHGWWNHSGWRTEPVDLFGRYDHRYGFIEDPPHVRISTEIFTRTGPNGHSFTITEEP